VQLLLPLPLAACLQMDVLSAGLAAAFHLVLLATGSGGMRGQHALLLAALLAPLAAMLADQAR
jgi:hypothetical protein